MKISSTVSLCMSISICICLSRSLSLSPSPSLPLSLSLSLSLAHRSRDYFQNIKYNRKTRTENKDIAINPMNKGTKIALKFQNLVTDAAKEEIQLTKEHFTPKIVIFKSRVHKINRSFDCVIYFIF